jgi:hypothetical protein
MQWRAWFEPFRQSGDTAVPIASSQPWFPHYIAFLCLPDVLRASGLSHLSPSPKSAPPRLNAFGQNRIVFSAPPMI